MVGADFGGIGDLLDREFLGLARRVKLFGDLGIVIFSAFLSSLAI